MREFPTCLIAIKRKETRLRIKEGQWIFLSQMKNIIASSVAKRNFLQMKTWFNIWVVTTLFTRELLQRRKNVIIEKFKCNICNYKTAYKPDLKRHIKSVHERIKPFKCSICEYKFGLQRRISTRKFMWCQYQNRAWISLTRDYYIQMDVTLKNTFIETRPTFKLQ